MIWVWSGCKFTALDCAPTFEAVLVKLGWEPTRSSAQRAIKNGEYRWRKIPAPEQSIKDWREQIPSGWPIAILKHKPYAKSVEVMVPLPNQGRRSWTRIWNEKPIGFWVSLLDRIFP